MEKELVQCDECKKPMAVNLNERKHPGGIIEVYIQCPHCKEEYISYVTDEWARREQKEVTKAHEKYMKKRQNLSVHMEKLKSKILEQKASE